MVLFVLYLAVLHHYKLTRFSNEYMLAKNLWVVLHHYKLTRFSNKNRTHTLIKQFYTITNLQGSQTLLSFLFDRSSFTPLQTYKVLKPWVNIQRKLDCFTPLQTYKVLKPTAKLYCHRICFTPLQTYKVLKPFRSHQKQHTVLHHYKLTRFSNTTYGNSTKMEVLHHYKLTRFSNYYVN